MDYEETPRTDNEDAFRSGELTLLRLWKGSARAIRTNILGAIAAAGLTFIPTVLILLFSVPSYTASGSVQLEDTGGLGGAEEILELGMSSGNTSVQTELYILRRREFLLRGFRDLNLHVRDPEEATYFSLDFDVTLRGESPVRPPLAAFRTLATQISVDETQYTPVEIRFSHHEDGSVSAIDSDGRETRLNVSGEMNRVGPVSFRLQGSPLLPGEETVLQFVPDGVLFESLSGTVSVSKVGTAREPTSLAKIAVTHTDRRTAQRLSSTLLNRYIAESLQWKSMSASKAADFIESQLDEVRETLQKSEEEYREFAELEDAIALDARVEAIVANAAEMEVRKMDLDARLRTYSTLEASIRKTARKDENFNLTTNFVIDDPVLHESIANLTKSETSLALAKAHLGPQHPQILALSREVTLQRAQLLEHIKSAKKSLAAGARELETEITSALQKMSRFPKKQLRLAQLTRELEVSQRIYSVLLERLEEAEILKASTTTDKRIVDHPLLPHKKSSSSKLEVITLGGAFSLLAGLLVATLLYVLRRTVTTTDELVELAELPIYGIVPVHNKDASTTGSAPRLSVLNSWKSSPVEFLEAFRALSVALYLSPSSSNGQIVTITSSQPGEGKSTVLSHLAAGLSKSNRKVLLIDLDLRKPVQHRIWQLPRSPGYSDLLSTSQGTQRLSDYLQHTDEIATEILTAGTKLADPTAAIATKRLPEFLESCRQQYDFVLIDAAPAFVSETLALAAIADLVLVVGRPEITERPNLRHALSALRDVTSKLGLVVNASKRDRAAYNSYYGGSGYTYYEEEETNVDDPSL